MIVIIQRELETNEELGFIGAPEDDNLTVLAASKDGIERVEGQSALLAALPVAVGAAGGEYREDGCGEAWIG